MGSLKEFVQIIFVLFMAFSYASDKEGALASKFQCLEVENNTEVPRVEKKVVLKKVLKKDEEFIRELFKDDQVAKYFVGVEECRKEKVLQECLSKCLSGGGNYSVIFDGDTEERVGIGSFDYYNNRIYISLAIVEHQRKQGYGTAVVKEYIQYIRCEIKENSVWAMSENPVMHALLKKLDFVEFLVTDYNQAPQQKHFIFN